MTNKTMQSSEFGEFKQVVSDLCTAYNIPFTDDRVRVMWDGLRMQSLRTIRQRAELHRAIKTKFPTIADLCPPRSDRPQQIKTKTGLSLQEQMVEYVATNKPLTAMQLAMPWKWIIQWVDDLDSDGKPHVGAKYRGVVVPADGDHPGYRVMLEDMQQFETAA